MKLFEQAAAVSPTRLSAPSRTEEGLCFTLRGAPSLATQPEGARPGHPLDWSSSIRSEHTVSIHFPRYFPAMPIEAFVREPVFHPNAHPDTGFLCLWSVHRVAHNVLNSIARVVAVLAWHLRSREPEHVMQPAAQRWFDSLDPAVGEALLPLPHAPLPIPYSGLPSAPERWRRRLS